MDGHIILQKLLRVNTFTNFLFIFLNLKLYFLSIT